jgi:hypothetical protein
MNEPYTPNIATLAANLKHASWEGSNVVIGGGVFTPKELQNGAKALEAFPDLLVALQQIDSNAAESVEWIRRVARAAIAKATGVTK